MKNVKDMATHVVGRNGVKSPALGANWTSRFITRHLELESKFDVRLEKQRGLPTMHKSFEYSFRTYETDCRILIKTDTLYQLLKVVKTHRTILGDTNNIDNKGFLMGKPAAVKVICKQGNKGNFKIQDGLRELITVLETVSAMGRVLPPMIGYKDVAQYQG